MKKIIFMLMMVIAIAGVEAVSENSTNVTAQGGNVTLLNINLAQPESQIWQGFYGQVTGGIYLSDADDNHFYDWNVVDAAGEVLATRNIVSDWSSINCTNQTQIYEEESRLNIAGTDSARINETFKNTTHPSFEVSGKILSGCRSTLTNNATSASSTFWNVLLNTNSTTTVYTVILDNDANGFDDATHDFQLLVPTDKTTGQSVYYIYVELN